MPKLSLTFGIFTRPLFLAGIALAVGCWLAGGLAQSSELADVPCGPLERAPDREKYVALTPEQWRFAEALFFLAPDTPASLPPGDGARMYVKPDGTASLVFVDGAELCAPIRIAPAAVEALMQIGRGEIVHVGSGL